MEITPKDIFEKHIATALSKNPALARDVNAVFHFDLAGPTGGQWTLDLTREEGWVAGGLQGTPQMTITVSDADFINVVAGKLNAQTAVITGKLKFKPMNIALASKLSKVLSTGRGN
jgi:hypothetical protein